MFILYANKTQLAIRKREPVTSGSVNIYRVRFEFSDDWDGLSKTAVFKAGSESKSVLLEKPGECIIPWETLKNAGPHLMAGVYGTRGVELVLPTVWADFGEIKESAAPQNEPHLPTPELWEQELSKKGDGLYYDGVNLSLMSGNKPLSTVQVVGGGGDGGPVYDFGHGLKLTGRTVSVDAVDDFKGDNTLPMTAAGVYATVGNIEALLNTI